MRHFIHVSCGARIRRVALAVMVCRRLCSVALLLGVLHCCAASCYFPIELQGQYAMQSSVAAPGGPVQYSQVNITAEAILPIWGHCHRRLGNSVILTDSSWGPNCSRCFHITPRSRNVLQVRTEGFDKCYTNEDAAAATCPDENTAQFKDIILYKTKELGGEEVKRVYCPFNGRFNFIYNVNDGSESTTECPDPVSELDNCPSGSALNLRFRRCSFENRDVTFQCLGQWAGPGDQHYLALRDTRPEMNQFPPYRCALYREESGTGNVFVAFSSDSTCSSGLRSATAGYETFSLSVMPATRWPSQVDGSNCRFPQWAHGYWQHMYIEGNTLTYKDHSTFKTFTIRCLGPDLGITERFPVFARTQCGEEMYTCIWLKRRGVNVLEFQLGLQSSTYYNTTLCSDTNFEPKIWITQGRLERLQESPCPLTGEYTGIIPDATNLCARLSSDCKSPEIMYYMVSDCSHSEIYEGTRRRGRNRRQTGTRIYRISNPRTSTSRSPTFAYSSFNQFNNVTDSKNGSIIQQDQPSFQAGKYSGAHTTQYDADTGHPRLGYSYYSSSSPRYPTSYHIGSSFTTYSPLDLQDQFLEEEYDPWTFSKTHGHQAGNQSFVKPHGPDYNSYSSKNDRNLAWASETSYGTSRGVQSESGRQQQGWTYGPRSQWNTQSTSMEASTGAGIASSTYGGDRTFRNDNLKGSQKTSGNFPGYYREQSFAHNTNSQDNQRSVSGNTESHVNQGIVYGDRHMAQKMGNNHPGPSSDLGFHYNENLPVTHSAFGNYPGSRVDWGFTHTENSQAAQRMVGSSSLSNKDQSFSHIEHQTPSSSSASIMDWGVSHSEHRSPIGYSESSRDHSFSQYEHRSSSHHSGSTRDQAFADNENLQRRGASHSDHSVPQVSSNSGEPRSQRNYGQSTEHYVKYSNSADNPGSYGDAIPNIGKHHSREHYHETLPPDSGVDQKTYLGARDQESSVSGRFQGQQHDRGSTVHWKEKPLTQAHWNPSINTQPLKDTISRTHEREGPRSILQLRPVQILPLPVQRPRYGDRPSAVPRTGTPSEREEREYRCLGQWEEDGLMYTYTQRRDVGTYECFVGSIISNNEIHIKEAGDHCQRNIDPMHYGMKLIRKGTCSGNQPNAGTNSGTGDFPQPRPTAPWLSSRYPPEPTKPWKPITAPPREASGADGCHNLASTLLMSVMIVFVHFLQH